VVDDIDTNLEIVEAYLQDRGYQVDCASKAYRQSQLRAARSLLPAKATLFGSH